MRRLLLLALLVGCGRSLKDDRFPTGSATVAATRHYDALVAVNVDEGTVSRLDRETGEVREIAVGSEPTRIARVDEELWVTLRGERGVAVLEETDRGLALDEVLDAGAEPFGIVATEDGKRVYVANALSDTVVEYDGRSREALRTFDVQDEPRWLALHPNERVLFVASAKHGTLSAIDLRSGEVVPVDLPDAVRFDPELRPIDLDVRITGDPSVSPDGDTLAIPTLYADTTTSVDDPAPDQPVVEGYASVGVGVSRVNPVLVTYDLGADGLPVEAGEGIFLATAPTSAITIGGVLPSFRSYPSSVTASPSGDEWIVTMEASNVALVVAAEPAEDRGDGTSTDVALTAPAPPPDGSGVAPFPFTSPEQAGFVTRAVAVVATAIGPRGVAFVSEDDARVHAFLDRAIEDLRFEEVRDVIDDLDHGEFRETLYGAVGFVGITRPSLPEEVEAGRRLFYSAVDTRMSQPGSGISCATCHLDGRTDGFTWTLRGEPRNTPSLAGPVQETAPVTWSEGVASVAEEAMLTTSLRMGGGGLTEAEALQIQAFVQAGRYPDVPRAGEQGELVALGREVFHRPEVGCATCHAGEYFTDNQSHLVLGELPTQTPTLRGIAASAPYLHDGSAPTLRAVVEWARGGRMGDTSSLTDREIDALVAYLESL